MWLSFRIWGKSRAKSALWRLEVVFGAASVAKRSGKA